MLKHVLPALLLSTCIAAVSPPAAAEQTGVVMRDVYDAIAYLLPLVAKGFFLPSDESMEGEGEAGWLVWGPPVVTAFGCVVLFFYGGVVQDFLMPIVTP